MRLQERLIDDFNSLLTDTVRSMQVDIEYQYKNRVTTPSTGVVTITTTSVSLKALREKIVMQIKSPGSTLTSKTDSTFVNKIETVFYVKKSLLSVPPRKGDVIICSTTTYEVTSYMCDTTDVCYRIFTGILP